MELNCVNPYYFMPKLRIIRTRFLKMKQEELAERIGIRRETISRYENNDIWPQSKTQYEAIIEAVTNEIARKNDKELFEKYVKLVSKP